MPPIRIALLTTVAMIAFAANSVLCRMSLGNELIDAASFTTIRLISGSLCLLLIMFSRNICWRPSQPQWTPVLSLLTYMVCFSFAYQSLSAGTGALLLFGCVQLTMIGTAIFKGEQLSLRGWLGLTLALCGLIYLLFPGIEAPDPLYSLLMATAGLAWGIYSLWGSQGGDPTESTTKNFLYATPMGLLVSLASFSELSISWQGALLAIASGAIASGIGYAIWYTVLKDIQSATAAIVQLSVPALATLGGAVLLAEPISIRIVLATTLTIGGIALFLTRKVNGLQAARKY